MALGLTASAWAQPTAGVPGAERAFRAGAHQVDISPTTFPVRVNAMFTERSATGVVDRLEAKALVLDDGENRIALCVVDTCMLPRELLDRAKELATQPAGIPIDRMLISATHTHSAPSAMGCLGSRVDPVYAAGLPARIAEAIAGAATRLERARVGWAVVEDWDHTFNRRWIRRPDRMLTDPFGDRNVRAHMHPGHQSPDAVGPSGPVDPGLSVLAVQSLQGRPRALLANYSQHYYGSPLLSSDYYGRFARHLAKALQVEDGTPSFVGLMCQGTSGDLMWMDYGSPARDIGYEAYAREVAERALEAYRRIAWRDWAPVRLAERTMSLRYRVPDENRLAWGRQMVASLTNRLPQTLPEIYAGEALHLHQRPQTELKLQAVRVGDLGIAALPNEVFALSGLKVKAQSPLQPTFTIELANGAEGYIPPPEQHQLGGYTTWPARTAGLEVQAEPRLVEAVLSLLEEVAGQPRRPLVDEPGPYAQTVLAARPLAYWRLNDMAVPLARDAAGQGHDAVYEEGVALYLPGVGSGSGRLPEPRLVPSNFSGIQINRAPHFAGGRVRGSLPTLGHTYSVALWFWNGLPFGARPITGYVFSRGLDRDPDARGDHLGIGGSHRTNETGRLLVFNGNQRNQVLVGRQPIRLRDWHHVAFVRDGRRVTAYLDGAPDLSGELEDTMPEHAAVFIGGRCDRFAGFEGKVDEVAVFNRALSALEVSAHFKAGGVSPPATVSVKP